jgi:HEAT repeats
MEQPSSVITPDAEPLVQPATTSARISSDWNGTEFYFPAFRDPKRALGLLALTAGWTGLVYLLLHSNAPLPLAVIFGLFDLLLFLGLGQMLFSSTRIRVAPSDLTCRKSFLGISRTRVFQTTDIEGVVPVMSRQQANNSRSYYALRLRTRDGRETDLVTGIADRDEARWLVSQIESNAGLRQDTHVEVDPLTAAAAVPVMPRRKTSPVVAFAIFACWVAVAVGVMVRPLVKNSRTNTRTARATAPASSARILPRRFLPLTDSDIPRVVSLRPQEQAEELLERSIQHDPRALALLQTHIADYKGTVRNSPRMAWLLDRADISRDLRVRAAFPDLNLAINEFDIDNKTADTLIERARHEGNPQTRAYDVYYLGMLGGRGVETPQIHSELLGWAHNDPDPYVRQWATEGLRFLGTDEALNDLFQIFTSDPSDTVRDRAGCNVSECGMFTRKQRMIMAPKFIELAENPATTAQMRSWCFLALSEITDARVPPDAKAWRNWYNQHGAEKMAEFAAMPQWQVRGDE